MKLAATEKHRLEEKQRQQRKEREKKGDEFVPAYFIEVEDELTGSGLAVCEDIVVPRGTVALDAMRTVIEVHRSEAGWVEEMNFERNAMNSTPVGDIQFGDGFLLYSNPNF